MICNIHGIIKTAPLFSTTGKRTKLTHTVFTHEIMFGTDMYITEY